jgi:acetyl-CoA/propionyl-CoA carboxylase biotin carboxyl carrier protein
VYGLDLVEWQLRLVDGQRVPDRLPKPRGHAIEARIYAEDPRNGFLPSVGTILGLAEPSGVRVDAAWCRGLEVTPHYDPLLAKIVAHAETRLAALDKLNHALAETAVLGVRTNVGYLRAILGDEEFREARLSTDLLERIGPRLIEHGTGAFEVFLAAAAAELLAGPAPGGSGGARASRAGPPSPWQTLSGFRLGEEVR